MEGGQFVGKIGMMEDRQEGESRGKTAGRVLGDET